MVRTHIIQSQQPDAPQPALGSIPPLIFRPDELVFVVGGGPSLKGQDLTRLRDKQAIGANNAALDFDLPVLFWSDRRWMNWNRDRILKYQGIRITRARPPYEFDPVIRVKYRPNLGLSDDPECVSGGCSGSSALNAAYLAGGRDFVLLGFDMRDMPADRWREGNYHGSHEAGPIQGQRTNTFIPAMIRMAERLRARGVRVRNATPGSALECFPMVRFEDVI